MNSQDRRHLEHLARFLIQSADEEDASIYGMSLLAKNDDQLDLFGPDKKRVSEILNTLIADTQKHQQLLLRAADLLLRKLV